MHYAGTGLPDIGYLSMGFVLGTVIVDGCRKIDPEFMQDLNEQEEAFGWYGPGRFAWFLTVPQPLDKPMAVRGGQGLQHHGQLT